MSGLPGYVTTTIGVCLVCLIRNKGSDLAGIINQKGNLNQKGNDWVERVAISDKIGFLRPV